MSNGSLASEFSQEPGDLGGRDLPAGRHATEPPGRAGAGRRSVRLTQSVVGLCTAVLGPRNFQIRRMGEGFTWNTKDRERDTEVAAKAWAFCKELIEKEKHDLLIFDEINVAMDLGYLDPAEVVDALKKKPKLMHIILTGRGAPEVLIEAADLVTEMREIKHPFNAGIYAQKGIEF